MFEFTDDFLINVEHIDRQHKHLFDLTNRAYAAIEKGADELDAVNKLLGDLTEYALIHFSDEEEYQRSVKYVGYPEHKMAHEAFVNKISNFEGSRADVTPLEKLTELLDYLSNWLINHILMEDKAITSSI